LENFQSSKVNIRITSQDIANFSQLTVSGTARADGAQMQSQRRADVPQKVAMPRLLPNIKMQKTKK
jgi:hypothetical protein